MRQKAREMKRLTSKLWNNHLAGRVRILERMAGYKSVPDRFRYDVRSSARLWHDVFVADTTGFRVAVAFDREGLLSTTSE
jgi:hypothetical protein